MFKVKDRVLIRKDSEYYTDREHNPKKVKGTVVNIEDLEEDRHNIKVDWDNGRSNVYRIEDLELVKTRRIKPKYIKDSLYA